jgi:hypothetical protein
VRIEVSVDLSATDGGHADGDRQGCVCREECAPEERTEEVRRVLSLDRSGERSGTCSGCELADRGEVPDEGGLDQQKPHAEPNDGAGLVADNGAQANADDGKDRGRPRPTGK